MHGCVPVDLHVRAELNIEWHGRGLKERTQIITREGGPFIVDICEVRLPSRDIRLGMVLYARGSGGHGGMYIRILGLP